MLNCHKSQVNVLLHLRDVAEVYRCHIFWIFIVVLELCDSSTDPVLPTADNEQFVQRIRFVRLFFLRFLCLLLNATFHKNYPMMEPIILRKQWQSGATWPASYTGIIIWSWWIRWWDVSINFFCWINKEFLAEWEMITRKPSYISNLYIYSTITRNNASLS